MNITAYDIAERFIGLAEVPGSQAEPAILAMLKLDQQWPDDDQVPWCSAFVNYIAWLLRLPRSKSLRARSWLEVGQPVAIERAQVGFDITVLNREHALADPTLIEAPGHVGFFAGREGGRLYLLGGNQGNRVSVAPFKESDLLGIRRLA